MRRIRSAPPAGRRRRPRLPVALVALALVALLAACGGADDSMSTEAASGDAGASGGGFSDDVTVDEAPAADRDGAAHAETDADGADGADGADRTDGASDGVPAAVQAALGRERIRTAWLTLEFEDPEAAVDDIGTAIESHGGFVALADLARDDGSGELYGSITLRVPSAELLPALDALEDLAADAPVRRIEEEEVGAQLTDLRAQVTNLTAYEEQLRELLAEVREDSSDPDDLLPIVERLQTVRSDIDRLRAQRDALDDRVALSTIEVSLEPTATDAPIVTSSWTPGRTVEEALAATGRALAGVADAAIWLVATAVPVGVVLFGPPATAWWWWRRRRPEVGPVRPTPPPAAPAPPA